MNIDSSAFLRGGVILVVALATGCASGPRLDAVPESETIAIVPMTGADSDDEALGIGNDAVAGDMGRGAGAGFVSGAVAGMTCGPWAPLCIPVSAAVGAVVGGVGGAVIGAARGLDRSEREALVASVNSCLEARDPRDALIRAVDHRLSKRWTTVDSAGDRTLTVALLRLSVDAQGNDQILLEMTAVAVLGAPDEGRDQKKTIKYRGTPSHVGLWIANDDRYIESQFEDAYRSIAEIVYLDLVTP